MINSELSHAIYNCLEKLRSDTCSSLEFISLENSRHTTLNTFDEDGQPLSSTELKANLLEISSLLDSLEFTISPFNLDVNKSIAIKGSENSLFQLKRSSANLENNKIHYSVTKSSSEQNLLREIGFSENLIQLLNSSTARNSGLIVCNGKQIETKLTLQCLYPDWPHLSIEEFKSISDCNKAFVYLSDFDPVALVTSILEIGKEKEVRVALADRIISVISLIPVKKQCGACAKPTPIPQASRTQFPFFLIDQVPTSYLFSRGCERCEYRSYRGITFLESFFPNGNDFLKKQSVSLNPEAIFQGARELGMRIFHESGLEKMQNGLTSLEQTLEHTPPLEQAFDELLNSSKSSVKTEKQKPVHTEKCILIVEDDSDQREILKLVFSKEGFNVLTAYNGKNALEILEQNQVQIIVSDIMMPVMNGLQLVRSLKNSSQYKNIPVLMITASSNPDHEVKLLEGGADDYCAKNVKKKVLLARVDKLLEKFKTVGNALDHFLT